MRDGGALIDRPQKHAARRLHDDRWWERGGVRKSWAVPRGPSLVAGARSLAVAVEDRRPDDADGEGAIAPGNAGAGVALLRDRGTRKPDRDPAAASGAVAVDLTGERPTGRWHPRRRRTKPHDAAARQTGEPDILNLQPGSVLAGRTDAESAAAAA